MCERELYDPCTEELLDQVCTGVKVPKVKKAKGQEMSTKEAGVTDLLEGVTLYHVGEGMHFGVIPCMTPEICEALLERNKNNRKPSKAKITEYRDAMLHGKWKLNGACLSFSDKGVGISMQHRLLAWQAAYAENPKIKVAFSVAYGTKLVNKGTEDVGYAQTLVHLFQRAKKDHAQVLGGAVRLLWLRCNSMKVSGGKGLRMDVAQEILKEHPGLKDSVEYVVELNKEYDGGLAPVLQLTYAAALHYLCLNADEATPKQVDEFFTQIASGEGGTDAPGVKFRNKVIKTNAGNAKLTRDAKVGLFILAFQALLGGGKMKNLRNLKEGEFPRLGGLDEEPQVEDEEGPVEVAEEDVLEASEKPVRRRKKGKAVQYAEGDLVLVRETGGASAWKGIIDGPGDEPDTYVVVVEGEEDSDDATAFEVPVEDLIKR